MFYIKNIFTDFKMQNQQHWWLASDSETPSALKLFHGFGSIFLWLELKIKASAFVALKAFLAALFYTLVDMNKLIAAFRVSDNLSNKDLIWSQDTIIDATGHNASCGI